MPLSDEKIKYFVDFIKKEIGIIYSKEVYFQLEQRLENIAKYLGIEGSEAVYQKAQVEGISGDFKQYLLDTATNNETSFFRDPRVFNGIEKLILPQLKTDQPTSFSYRIWSCAASFGQEPYSLAMLAYEFMKKNPGHPKIEIIATDIADHALKRCKEARYSQLEVQRGLSASRMLQYFDKQTDDSWQLKAEIKDLVTFKKLNLLDSFQSMGRFNLILCRYVLIYQDGEKKKAIVQKLEDCLQDRGSLILGASESAMGLSQILKQEAVDNFIYYQKKI